MSINGVGQNYYQNNVTVTKSGSSNFVVDSP